MEFQAIVMAAGRGSRITDLAGAIPKALLPMANRPLVWYPLKQLELAGFEEAIVVVVRSQQADIQAALTSESLKLRLEYFPIPDDVDWGTADSLRAMRDRVRSRDVLVVSCDVICDAQLHRVADLHRARDATLTLVLAPHVNIKEVAVPGGKQYRKLEKDIVGLASDGSRLLFFSALADFEEAKKVVIKKSVLRQFGSIEMHTHLQDAHIYLLKRWVLDLLASEPSIASLKGELLPYLVRQQFTRPPADTADATGEDAQTTAASVMSLNTRPSVHGFAPHDDIMAQALAMSSYSGGGTMRPRRKAGEAVRCYAFTHQDGVCLRANSLAIYCEANRQVPRCLPELRPDAATNTTVAKDARAAVGADSLVAEGCTVGERALVKHSNVGAGCVLGAHVKLTNCVLMERVTIGPGCTLTGCVVCEGATLGEKCELKDCLVACNQHVQPLAKFSNDILVEINRMMEI